MDICNLYPGGFASCCYLLCEESDAVLIDCSAPVSAVKAELDKRGVTLRAILCTHGHFDHILTADELRETLHVPLYIHEEDAEMLTDSRKNAHSLFFGTERTWHPAEHTFCDGERLTFGALSRTVMSTPGHSKGSSVFLTDGILLTGDTLFVGGYGRTDLHGGDTAALVRSLQALSCLPEETVVYPGHGEHGTLSEALEQFRS